MATAIAPERVGRDTSGIRKGKGLSFLVQYRAFGAGSYAFYFFPSYALYRYHRNGPGKWYATWLSSQG